MGSRRKLGRGGIEVAPIGLGGWTIGGPCWRGDEPLGYGEVDDDESVRAVRRAVDLGVELFDTSDMYGAGHGERVLGQALGSRRDDVLLVGKFGYRIDEARRRVLGTIDLPDGIASACEASLRRLATDRIDVYLLHLRALEIDRADDVFDELDRLVEEGKIRGYGWSTDDPARAASVADRAGCVAIEQSFNVLQGDQETLAVCERRGLASLQRSPLAMGFLLGARPRDASGDDVRSAYRDDQEGVAALIGRASKVRDELATADVAPVEGALTWLLRRSPVAVPIPGFRTVRQVEEIAAALDRGPMDDALFDRVSAAAGPRDLPADPWDLRGG